MIYLNRLNMYVFSLAFFKDPASRKPTYLLTYLLNNKYILLIVIEICLGVMTC